MKHCRAALLVLSSCLVCAGCNAAKVAQLTAEVESLRAEVQQLQAQNAQLESNLKTMKAELDKTAAIRRGYEAARAKLAESLGALAPLLGNTASPLPSFEELRDPSWVGKLAPSQQTAAGLNELQDTLRGLMGNPAPPVPPTAPPAVPPKTPPPAPRR